MWETQGSILGPLLFLLFINYLPLTLKEVVSAVDLYANDTTIYDKQNIAPKESLVGFKLIAHLVQRQWFQLF